MESVARSRAAPRRRVAVASLALFAVLALLVESHVVDALDLRAERVLASIVHRLDLVGVVQHVYVSSELVFVALLGLGVGVAWLTGRVALRRLAVEVPLALVAAEALARLLAPVIERPRPFVAHPDLFAPLEQAGLDPSFPSDGATAAFAIAAVVAVRCRRLALPALGIAALVAAGRLLVAVHYPSDVVGGALVGVAAAVLTCWLATCLAPGLARYPTPWRPRRPQAATASSTSSTAKPFTSRACPPSCRVEPMAAPASGPPMASAASTAPIIAAEIASGISTALTPAPRRAAARSRPG